MRGQLWETCHICNDGREQAVCMDCGCCKRHCKCQEAPSREQQQATLAQRCQAAAAAVAPVQVQRRRDRLPEGTISALNNRGRLINDLMGEFSPIANSDGTVEGATEIVMEAAAALGEGWTLTAEQVAAYYKLWHELPRRS